MSIYKCFAYKVQCDEMLDRMEYEGMVQCNNIVFVFFGKHTGKYGGIEVIEAALKNGFGYDPDTEKFTCLECLIRTGQVEKAEEKTKIYGIGGERLN